MSAMLPWTTDEDGVRSLLLAALDMFFDEDADLSPGVSERCIAHRLAFYLEMLLRARGETWSVDCEYNRDGDDPKRVDSLVGKPSPRGERRGDVTPDIIVHRRGTNGPNVIAVELKKTDAVLGDDLDKLDGYRDEFGYHHAVMLWIAPDRDGCIIQFLRRGERAARSARDDVTSNSTTSASSAPVATPTIGAAASAAWLEQLDLDASTAPQWYVEITIPTDASDVRLQVNIYHWEWGVTFRRGNRVSSIRVTDVPFIHGVDDDNLLPDLPALDRIGDLLANLERRFTLVFDLTRMRARSNFARTTALVRTWLNAQRLKQRGHAGALRP